jgi:hypothetical protein
MKLKINQIVPILLLLFALGNEIAFAQTKSLVVIDQAFVQKEDVLLKIPSGTTVLHLKTTSNPWKDIREKLSSDTDIKQIHLFAESGYDSLLLGGIEYNRDNVQTEFELAMLEGIYTGTHYQLMLYTCNLSSNPEGLELIKELGNKTYFNIAASTNCTEQLYHNINFDYTTLDQPIAGSIFKN